MELNDYDIINFFVNGYIKFIFLGHQLVLIYLYKNYINFKKYFNLKFVKLTKEQIKLFVSFKYSL